ncbi:MAG: hypothetical protein ACI4KF_02320 [Huintestinicola sp.]
MLESSKKYTGHISPNNEGHVPDSIKVHTESAIKIIPEENRSHLGDTSGCRIMPGDKFPDMETELGYTGISLDSGENIRIVPTAKKNR